MVSTYLSYRLYATDMAKSLTREASLTDVSRQSEYYKANIGKITSVEDFLKDTRVYTYAMKAHGLEDMIYAKAFMRKVLESDLTDANSFVRLLADTRFLNFAEAFNFSADGSIKPSEVTAQGTTLQEDTIGLYSDRRIKQGATDAIEIDYFRGKMATIQSVDELVSNPRLFDFALKAYGLDPKIASNATIRNVLTSDLSDPSSVANQLPNDKYRALAAAFSFETDGSVAVGAMAQTATQTTDTIFLHYEKAGLDASPAAAAFKSQYFLSEMASVTSVDDLVNNPKLFDFVNTAFGLDPIFESVARMRDVLTSDLSDPASVANTLTSASYRKMAAAFNFNTDGTLDSGVAAQTAQQQAATNDGFFENYDNKAARFDKFDADYYRITIFSVKTVDQLLSIPKLYNYVLNAFGLDPATEKKETIRRALQSDLGDPTSFANATRDKRYKNLAEAFNFDTNGVAQTQKLAQTLSGMGSTMLRYIDRIGDPNVTQPETKAETDYYRESIPKLQSMDELIEDDRLVAFILKAYGLSAEDVTTDVLRQILTSDLTDLKSFANQSSNTQYRALASAFNFNADGQIVRETANTPQDRQDLLTTTDLYLRQSMEQRAGSENEAVRLALYFQRKAPSVSTVLSILADKAIFEVVRTALNLPESMSLASLETQEAMISKQLDIADFKDPKKLEKFLARFSALYDVTNAASTQQSLISVLFDN